MRAVTTIAGVELRRFLRDRSNIFFVFIFPLLLVLLIGSQFGGDGPSGRVAVSGPDSELRTAVVAELEETGAAVTVGDHGTMLERVARGRADVGLVLDADAAAAYEAGEDLEAEVVPGAQAGSVAALQQVRTALRASTSEVGQVAALAAHGVAEDAARDALAAAAGAPQPRVVVEDVDEISQELSGLGQFDLGASSQILLFVFLISLAGSSTLIQARRYGVVSRTLAAPVTTVQALAGQALGRYVIAVFQGGYIMITATLLFGVDWGHLPTAIVIVLVFGLVAAGAAMLVGAVMDNEGAAVGVGVGAGLVLAALGGCMFPLELFPDTLRTVAHITPHAWAYDAFAEVQRHGGTVIDILPQLGVLLAMAVALLALGAWALRRSTGRAM